MLKYFFIFLVVFLVGLIFFFRGKEAPSVSAQLTRLEQTQADEPNRPATPPIETNASPTPEIQEKPEPKQFVFELIENRFSGDSQKRSSAMQLAKAFFSIRERDLSDDELLQKLSYASACRALHFGAQEAQDVGRWLESLVFDSDELAADYLNWNQQWNGRLMELPPLERGVVCDS
ncbi:MAG: hypothetical protein ACO3LE_08745 [Bdellovibrionota bacterium]